MTDRPLDRWLLLLLGAGGAVNGLFMLLTSESVR